MAGTAGADTLRIATYNVELSRKGPGLMLRDILGGADPQVAAVLEVIRAADPDVLLLTGFDWDAGGAALGAFAERAGAYPFRFALRPNTGLATGLDMNGDGRTGDATDAQGYGRFTGADGMALLSRVPVDAGAARAFTGMLWRDLPGAELPQVDGKPFPSEAAQAAQRLSTVAHWDVPLIVGERRLHLLAFNATPPVFDGPEDRLGLRNRDEIRIWSLYLDGKLDDPPPDAPFVILGDANLDPADGEGRHEAVAALLARADLHDPAPRSAGGAAAADARQRGDPALDTAAYPKAPGNLRLDYVLPSRGLAVADAGVWWPAPGAPGADDAAAASRHRLVWVDIALD